MNYSQAVKILTKKEGKKVQVSRGNVMEVLSLISEMVYKGAVPIEVKGRMVGVISPMALMLYKNGQKRALRKKPKK